MAANVVGEGIRYVRPILSTNHADAKRRVLNLYRAWHRQIPYVDILNEISPFVVIDNDKRVCCRNELQRRAARFAAVKNYNVPITVPQGRAKVRELFFKNKHVSDLRSIDMLIIKGRMELVETIESWKQENHIMMFFDDNTNADRKDFLQKFYEGHEP